MGMNYQEKAITEFFEVKLFKSPSTKSYLNKEGIIVSFDGILCVDYCSDEYVYTGAILFLEKKGQEELLAKYAYYYLLANKDWIYRILKSVRRLTPLVFSRLTIKYPTVSEQYEIVQKLDLIHKIKGWQFGAYGNLTNFPYSYYQRMEKASGFLWKNEMKLSKLVDIRQGKGNKESLFLNVKVNSETIEFSGKSKVILRMKSEKSNSYFLACALPTRKLFRMLRSFTIANKIPLLQMRNLTIKLPSKKEQLHFEEIYRKVDEIKSYMKEFVEQINLIEDFYLYNFLYRKNFGKTFSSNTNKDSGKYSYENPTIINTLQTFNAIRAELYKELNNDEVIQYFDSVTQSVCLKRK